MKPRSGAISKRACASMMVGVAALLSASAVAADEADPGGAAPGPRPQAIASTPMVLLEEFIDDAPASAESEPPAEEDAKPAKHPDDSAVALGAPVVPLRESQLLAPPADAEPGALGALDPRTNEVTRVVGALAAVIGLMLLLRMAARKLGGPMLDGGRPSGVLLVLARYPIARGQHLVLLKLGRRIVLCHQAKGQMSTLCEIEHEDEVAALLARIEAGSRGRDAARFEKMLEEFNQDHRRRSYTAKAGAADMRSAMAAAPVIDLTKRAPGSGGGLLRLRRTAS